VTKDLSRGIEEIRYNFLNLPSKITFTEKNAYIRNMYDANGHKFKMITYANIPLVIGRAAPAKASAVNKARAVGLIPDSLVYDTPFRNQFIPGLELIGVLGQTTYHYCDNIVYRNGVPTIYREDGFTTLVRMRFPEFHYYIRDHQGNIRGVTDGSGNIEQHNDYYPFGGMMASSTGGAVQPYRYTGKELVRFQGLDWLDYGARWYDPATLRWNGVDKLAENYTPVSPYVYCLDNPINAIDVDGRLTIFINGFHVGDGGSSKYWDGLDMAIMSYINDYHSMYIDGSIGGIANSIVANSPNLSASQFGNSFAVGDNLSRIKGNSNFEYENRYAYGKKRGLIMAKGIFEGLKEGETIKIVTHSMGAGYAKGFIKGLQKYAKQHDIDINKLLKAELDLAPYQPSHQKVLKTDPHTTVISHRYDNVAGCDHIEGAENHITRKDLLYFFNITKEHSVRSFSISEIKAYWKL